MVSSKVSSRSREKVLGGLRIGRILSNGIGGNLGYIGPEHVLLALARDDESEAGELLGRFGLSHTRLRGAVMRGVDTATGAARDPASATPTLDEYSRDLTQMAREGKLDPVIGRAEEVETTIEILSRRTKNNPVLIGDPGVG